MIVDDDLFLALCHMLRETLEKLIEHTPAKYEDFCEEVVNCVENMLKLIDEKEGGPKVH